MSAITVDGALAKARVLLSGGWEEEALNKDLRTHLSNIGPDGDAFKLSIALDLVRLAKAEARSNAGASASLASAPDPIFDLIEAHRTAWARIADAQANLEATLPKNEFTTEVAARDREFDDAANKLFETPPATPSGARAIIGYLIEWDKEHDPETSYKYLQTLLRSPMLTSEEARA